MRCASDGSRREIELKIIVPRGALPGTEFIFRHLGDAHRGSTPGDVVCVLREVPHISLVRQGDDLIHISSREAAAHELLLLINVPTLQGAERQVVAHTSE